MKVSSASAAASAAGSASTTRFQPASTVSTHSVSLRSVMHGTPDSYASFWTPPESVAIAIADASSATISM
jgi:alanine racemase